MQLNEPPHVHGLGLMRSQTGRRMSMAYGSFVSILMLLLPPSSERCIGLAAEATQYLQMLQYVNFTSARRIGAQSIPPLH